MDKQMVRQSCVTGSGKLLRDIVAMSTSGFGPITMLPLLSVPQYCGTTGFSGGS
ncbi:hypothetical protein [Yoonia sp.]|uniref:hypothetical protein n=1 Tax=Yoonia sp. TaxID=2212373 RepID=UPI003A4E3A84